jgi:hypothetical protein
MIGPFVITAREEPQRVHQEVEPEIWFGLGISRVLPAMLDFESAFSTYSGITADHTYFQKSLGYFFVT